jgi:uncharacterized Zn-binding protein involved in type VI secretion
MGKPAARVGDMHVCPMVTPGVPPVPHVGGPILPPGGVTVMIGGMPAARATDMCTCVGPPDLIALGSTGVFICGLPAARMGDITAHGGTITLGCPTVLIGEISPGAPPVVVPPMVLVVNTMTPGKAINTSANPLQKAVKSAASPVTANSLSQANSLIEASKVGTPFCKKCAEKAGKKGWFEATILDKNGDPISNEDYIVVLPDKKEVRGKTDSDGRIDRMYCDEGNIELSFPNLNADDWKVK